jgi:PEP-CTERM motif
MALLAVGMAAAAEMEVDSTAVITQYQNTQIVGTFDESAVSFFDTLGPRDSIVPGVPPTNLLAFDPAGNVDGFYFSVPGFSAFAIGPRTDGTGDPGLRSPAFQADYQASISGLSFIPISQSTYLSSADPWSLFFNGATFYAYGTESCYEQWCTGRGDPSNWVGTNYTVSFSGTIHSVPEPGTLGLMGVALAGLFVARRRSPMSAQAATIRCL